MITVVLVIHLLICIALVGLILLQRSEGGGLGMGGGGGGGGAGGAGLMSGRAAGNALTRTTGILAACFFATSMTLALLANEGGSRADSILEDAPIDATPVPAVPGEGEAPAAPAPDAAPAVPQAPIAGD